ncbi:hypothetical protein AQUCO_00700403v1 [Aquilegia coerulea]|uniref:Cupin type-1 domain-containing protein n=1 Tax=Aquilegia coerulea TaxID=218851 RepID=A0A2G5EJW2_AQUCA|nr:hypothetical protein AQUCO_00700403v1 [Aquilegia coerulea]
MAFRNKLSFFVFVLFVFLVSATFSLADEKEDLDQLLRKCKQQCRTQPGLDKQEHQKCERDCEEYVKVRQRQQEEGQGGKQGDGLQSDRYKDCVDFCYRWPKSAQLQHCLETCEQVAGAVIEKFLNTEEREDPQREYEKCQQGCQERRWSQERVRSCLKECDEHRKQREQEQGGRGGQEQGGQSEEKGRQGKGGQSEEEGQQGGRQEQGRQSEEDENPYLFHQQKFSSHIKSQQGKVQLLEKFNKRSDLLQGIENYRISYLEANPSTFAVPNHVNAETIFFVLSGQGTITLLQENNRETHNLERGDIIMVRAGTILSFVNRDNKEKLRVASLLQPDNVPGDVKAFVGAGGRDPESYYNTFSNEILEAAFNVKGDQLRKLFEGQNKGVFLKASQEQIKALSRDESSEHGTGGPWPFVHGKSQSNKPYNMFNKERLSQSNQYGKFYVVSQDDYKMLQELDVQLSYANITKGAMIGPYYNSRSTKIAMVVNGNGEKGQRGSTSTYQKMSGRISRGDVYVTPAGHPFVAVASNDENLEVVMFEINARYNHRYQLAGKNNILKQLEKEAKELSFNVPAKQVEEILNKQQGSLFYPGPKQQQQQQGGHADA